jgi:aminoglycoside phosphotransferase (APT) family kinase protein
MPKPIEPDDLVERRQDVAPGAREPLLVLEPLRAFLDDRGLGQGPIGVEAIGDGHSFETFLLRRQGAEVVLRRPPRPPLTPGVHDVLREARVLGALGESSVRAPRLLAVCEDTSILGVPFTVMERVPGIVIARDEELPAALDAPEQCRRIGEELIDTLVELHACDFEACGLGGLGRADGFLERRLARNREAWERDAVREIPDIDRTAELLAATMPPPQAPGLVHGDFRLGNVMYAPTAPARLLAILDWETTTIGDPLADLGFTIATYPEPEDSDGVLLALGSVALRPGFPTRAELVARYAERSGRSVEHLRWYMAFGLWRVAIQLEGLYGRLVGGLSQDPWYREFEHGVPELAGRAARLASSWEPVS